MDLLQEEVLLVESVINLKQFLILIYVKLVNNLDHSRKKVLLLQLIHLNLVDQDVEVDSGEEEDLIRIGDEEVVLNKKIVMKILQIVLNKNIVVKKKMKNKLKKILVKSFEKLLLKVLL